ncbi:uncharacterized protein GGS22DRAFT_167494 [Annulohypoxylon maeteangense]|uniref:uncharacterized protein n=1 Tax=Annulohypoxylon maeteangense TaxID=1927788 RepID=UPI0020074F45|nr:uncharacterized protein GGS22DRAFT_167494 [Annulohypoxylon maeteangense]KAI0883591.1 hypothetical protein GGS22DRAFT_167494 [Annulohypoxylon maeteangense]
MAILEELPGVEVTVVVAGRDAVEYDDPDASEQPAGVENYPTSTKYIECIDGTNFSIKYNFTGNYDWSYRNHSLCLRLKADGTYLRGVLIGKHHLVANRKVYEVQDRVFYNTETREWQGQKFKFSTVTTVDDVSKDRIRGDMEVAKNLGTIVIEIHRCKILDNSPPPTKAGKASEYELSEKSLKGKAISHGTSLSPPNKIGALRFSETEYLDKAPIAVFQFHYRSRDALKREMIIPRTPSPSPGARRGIAHMSRAELERLARERLEQLQGGGNVKEERKPAIKKESKRKADAIIDLSDDNPRPAPSPVFIDLTDD